jgi:Putative undecaprenyl diphosphate synthase
MPTNGTRTRRIVRIHGRTPRQLCEEESTNLSPHQKAPLPSIADRDRSLPSPSHMSLLPSATGLQEKVIDRFRRALLAVLRAGPIPQHVAFVMDGNRRYARTKGMQVIQGHMDGFVALRRVRFTFPPSPPPHASMARERISSSSNDHGRFWKFAQPSTSSSSLCTPLQSTTSNALKKKSTALCV